MRAIDLIKKLTNQAVKYRDGSQQSLIRNKHMNEVDGAEIPQEHIDAVLVDFINFIGAKYCIDVALYTKDLTDKK